MKSIISIYRSVTDQLVLPFLWAEDGFSEPSKEMAAAILFGLSIGSKLSTIGGACLIVLGLVVVLAVLVWILRVNTPLPP